MRRVDFENWKKQKSRVCAIRLRTDSSFEGHVPGNRPRDPDKERLLSELDKARWQRYVQSGKLQILGPRRWEWRIDFDN